MHLCGFNFFFFNDPAPTQIYTHCHTLSLHAALPICFSLLRPSLFFARLPRWVRILRQPLDERVASLRDPQTVAQMVADLGPDGGERMMGPLVEIGRAHV